MKTKKIIISTKNNESNFFFFSFLFLFATKFGSQSDKYWSTKLKLKVDINNNIYLYDNQMLFIFSHYFMSV